ARRRASSCSPRKGTKTASARSSTARWNATTSRRPGANFLRVASSSPRRRRSSRGVTTRCSRTPTAISSCFLRGADRTEYWASPGPKSRLCSSHLKHALQHVPYVVEHLRLACRLRVHAVVLHQAGIQRDAVEQERDQRHIEFTGDVPIHLA